MQPHGQAMLLQLPSACPGSPCAPPPPAPPSARARVPDARASYPTIATGCAVLPPSSTAAAAAAQQQVQKLQPSTLTMVRRVVGLRTISGMLQRRAQVLAKSVKTGPPGTVGGIDIVIPGGRVIPKKARIRLGSNWASLPATSISANRAASRGAAALRAIAGGACSSASSRVSGFQQGHLRRLPGPSRDPPPSRQ